MSLFGNIFGSNNGGVVHNGGAQPAPAVITPAPAPAAATTAQTPAPAPAGPNSSLDSLTSIWENLKNADGTAVAAPVDPTAAPIYQFDPAKVSESAKKLNFTADLPPELVTTALGGGDGAAAALLQLINHASQNAVAAMTLQTGKLVNDGLSTNNTRFKELLPRQIKQVQLDQTETTNPALAHPAVQPLVAAMKKAAFAKDPKADPAKVTRDIENYFEMVSQEVAGSTPAAVAAKKTTAAGEQDWSTFLPS